MCCVCERECVSVWVCGVGGRAGELYALDSLQSKPLFLSNTEAHTIAPGDTKGGGMPGGPSVVAPTAPRGCSPDFAAG